MILPSFIGIIEGTSVNEPRYEQGDFSIIPGKKILDFNVFVLEKDGKILNFGEVGKL